MDLGLIEQVVSLGIGAVIAVIVIIIKQRDDKEHATELDRIHREHADDITRISAERQQMYQTILERQFVAGEKITEALHEVRNGLERNTAAIGGLATLSDIAEQLRKLTNERRQ